MAACLVVWYSNTTYPSALFGPPLARSGFGGGWLVVGNVCRDGVCIESHRLCRCDQICKGGTKSDYCEAH